MAKVRSVLGSSVFSGDQPETLRREKSCVFSLLRKHRPRDGSCVPTLGACATDRSRPREEKERLLAFLEHQSPTAGPHDHCLSLLPPHRGDASSNLLTFRSRCRRIGLVLGQQTVFQPVICSRNTARCPALPAWGGAMVTVPGMQEGCGNLPGAGLRLWLRLVACWDGRSGGPRRMEGERE